MRSEPQSSDPLISRWRTLSRKERVAVLASIPAERRSELERGLHRIELEAEAQETQDRDSLAGHSPWLAQLIEDANGGKSGSDRPLPAIKPAARKALLDAYETAEQSSPAEPSLSLVQVLIDMLPKSWGLR